MGYPSRKPGIARVAVEAVALHQIIVPDRIGEGMHVRILTRYGKVA
jgi:hypothetical protein